MYNCPNQRTLMSTILTYSYKGIYLNKWRVISIIDKCGSLDNIFYQGKLITLPNGYCFNQLILSTQYTKLSHYMNN